MPKTCCVCHTIRCENYKTMKTVSFMHFLNFFWEEGIALAGRKTISIRNALDLYQLTTYL